MTSRPITIPLKTATASVDDLNSPQKEEAGSIFIHKKIKLKGENYLVVGSQDYVKASNPNSRFTRVILGSKNHIRLLRDVVVDFELQQYKLKLDLQFSSDAAASSTLKEQLDKVERKKQGRERELAFLVQQESLSLASERNEESDEEDGEDEDDGDTDTDSISVSPSSAASDASTVPSQVIHVTNSNFGAVKNLVIIKNKHKEEFFQKPMIRQYFKGPALHREEEELHGLSLETFIDLIYCGSFQKCESLMINGNYSWLAFLQLVLTMLPLVIRWRDLVQTNNTMIQNDLIRKFLDFIWASMVVLMATCISNAFDISPEKNTGNIFIALFLLSIFLSNCYTLWILYYNPKFKVSLLSHIICAQLVTIPYYILFFLPANNTIERQNIRLSIWAISCFFQFGGTFTFMMFVYRFIAKRMENKGNYRVAVNIEHMSERAVNLTIMILGEFVGRFLVDFVASEPVPYMLNSILGFIIAISFFYVYLRAETSKHHKHAMRRSLYAGVVWSALIGPIAIFLMGLTLTLYQMIDLARKDWVNGTHTYVEYQFQTIFTTTAACVYFCLCLLTMSHLDEAPRQKAKAVTNCKVKKYILSQTIERKTRVYIKLFAGVLLVILGTSLSLPAQAWLLIVAAVSFICLVVEEVGRVKRKVRLIAQSSNDLNSPGLNSPAPMLANVDVIKS